MCGTTLYIGMFDLEKAFDKVFPIKLLQKLIKMGIGKCMLEALKRLYIFTFCILTFGKEFSKKFQTFTGIRQGAASSAVLFIAFINDRCQPEPTLDTLHCLLHADDTTTLSTRRDLFILKCNLMIDYFRENFLSLNLSKSGYFVIDGVIHDIKTNLLLKNGILKYKSALSYLGVKISDTGNIMYDIQLYLREKRSNVTVKYVNACKTNNLAPLDVKLQVLNTCMSATLVYGCETWGISKIKSVETIYRQGLKTALSVRDCINNEIVYIESGEVPFEIRVAKQQLKFWSSIRNLMENNPDHYISKLAILAENTSNVKYYKAS